MLRILHLCCRCDMLLVLRGMNENDTILLYSSHAHDTAQQTTRHKRSLTSRFSRLPVMLISGTPIPPPPLSSPSIPTASSVVAVAARTTPAMLSSLKRFGT